ncbi:MAG TPA: ABC transporter substrate-binding protein [Chloroflexota bacterium]|nr:ABC transporter substrate-binding protein [Chloroflexota bacterium]
MAARSTHLIAALEALVLVALVACAAPAAPAPAAPAGRATAAPAFPPALQALVDGARQEGRLEVTSSAWDDAAHMRRLADGFNKAYGLNLDVHLAVGPNMAEMANRMIQELQAGRAAASDVMLGSETNIAALVQANALEPVDWASWSRNIHDPRLIAADGAAVEVTTRVQGIVYQSQKISGSLVPTSLQDLLKPEYKGRIGSTPYASGFTSLAASELWGEERTVAYMQQFVGQLAGLIGCGEGTRIVSGEFDILALACGDERIGGLKTAPLGFAIPTDAALLGYWYVGVPKHAAHPNAAKLFADYMLSREAQDLWYEYLSMDHHLVPGSKIAPDIERLQAQGVPFTETDVDFVLRNSASMNKARPELVRLLQQR